MFTSGPFSGGVAYFTEEPHCVYRAAECVNSPLCESVYCMRCARADHVKETESGI